MTPVFGFLENAEEAFRELITNVLLVAGGFLVGYLLGGALAWAVARYALRLKNGTEHIKAVGKPVGGIVLALIVALIVFTGRGKGPGEGGEGKGAATNPSAGTAEPKAPDARTGPNVVVPKVDLKPADVTLRVTVLGGDDVKNERFYLLEDDRNPLTFPELKAAVEARRAREKGKVSLAILFPAKNALSRDHPAVTQLAKWAAEVAGLDVVFPAAR
jgi:hypothetical protein